MSHNGSQNLRQALASQAPLPAIPELPALPELPPARTTCSSASRSPGQKSQPTLRP